MQDLAFDFLKMILKPSLNTLNLSERPKQQNKRLSLQIFQKNTGQNEENVFLPTR